MGLTATITYNKKENTTSDVLFIILIKWLNTDADKTKLIKHITTHTTIEEDIYRTWLDFLQWEDVVTWSKTEVGKQYIR